MTVTALFFAVYRDDLGHRSVQVDLPEGATVTALWEHCVAQHPRLHALRSATRFARNNVYVDADTVLAAGDEVAFLPPVSGGEGAGPGASMPRGPFMVITAEPLRLADYVNAVSDGAHGAVVTFSGVVRHTADDGRQVVALEYEAYEEMARAALATIATEIAGRWPPVAAHAVAIGHRTGHVEVGGVSVIIAVASPHRQAAFEACAFAIERLKDYVPIWKKEIYSSGEAAWLGMRS